MSRERQSVGLPRASTRGIDACLFPMAPGAQFDWHTHGDDQLAWASRGVLTVVTDAATWLLPRSRALWIPAGARHEVRARGTTVMRSLYLKTTLLGITWKTPTVVRARPLLMELIEYLGDETLDSTRRERAAALLVDLLEPLNVTAIEVRMPADGRALSVAEALLRHPAENQTLTSWGRRVGASGRTLERAFLSETGVPFSRWRTLARLKASLPMLASGQSISVVAPEVGYESTSAFVAAFRREVGLTPTAYFRAR
ncbi:MAG: helix-turn-helix transcriptional regulator [Candidatus Dormiibacterota bacterium]